MKAIQTSGEGLLINETDAPRPQPGEVAVRILASAVNPVDVMFTRGHAHRAVWVPEGVAVGTGWDVAGVVSELGEGVTQFAVGDRVAGLAADITAPFRGHSEAVTLRAADLAAIPEGVAPEQAGAMTLNALTADQSLDAIGEPAGRTLLITGAAGSVGQHAVVEAARRGFKVFGLARPSDAGLLRALGAEPVGEVEPGRYDAAIDAAALNPIAGVKDGGDIVGLLGVAPLVAERGIKVHQLLVHPDAAALARLLADAAAGRQPVTVLGTFPRSRAAEAFEAASAPGQRGRWVIVAD